MEYTIATKRIRRILDHVSGCEDAPPPCSHFSALNCNSTLNCMDRRYDNRTLFVPQDSVKENQDEPLFSRKAREDSSFPDSIDVHSWKQDSASSSTEALKFAGTLSRKMEEKPVNRRSSRPSISDELPGVNINGIRVEVDDHNLTITGKRILQQQWRLMSSSDDSKLTYHRKEILQGPYEVNWPLPMGVNMDHISAEFV